MARSYEEAREAITLVERLHPHDDMVQPRDLAYFDCGEVATATARRLHVSVRTVTYRRRRSRA